MHATQVKDTDFVIRCAPCTKCRIRAQGVSLSCMDSVLESGQELDDNFTGLAVRLIAQPTYCRVGVG